MPLVRIVSLVAVLSASIAIAQPAKKGGRTTSSSPAAVSDTAAPAAPAAASTEPTVVPVKLLHAAGDLEVTLWAKSPLFRNPTNIDIDSAGRIWVAEGANYRKHTGRDPAGDRIVVLEDTDGDGRADKSWVFVQEPVLIAPLGIAVVDNKIYVSNAPDLIVYTDVDRDLKFDARYDTREVLLSGFNGNNHDHALHSLTVGPDGRYHFSQGNAGAFVTDRSGRTIRVGSMYDPLKSGATPIYGWKTPDISGAKSDDGHVYVGGFAMSMKPDGTDLRVIGYNFRNSYEQTVTSFGEVFQNDNDDPPAARTAHLLEYGNAGFFSRDGTRIWSADRRPGQDVPTAEWRQEDPGTMPSGDVYGAGAPTGIVFYEGDALGAKWRGALLSAEAARNTILGYFPELNGAGYKLERFDFLTSNREGKLAGIDSLRGVVNEDLQTYFRPSDIAVGPDGAIYVSDWFDPRVGGHADRDDTLSGAIYRIAPRGFKPRIPTFDLKTMDGRIQALRSPAVNVRSLGFFALLKAGDDAVEPVARLLGDSNPYIAARAIGLLAQLGPRGVAKVEGLLSHADERFRAAAFKNLRSGPRGLEHAAALAKDRSALVRREVALAMRDVPFAKSKDILLQLAAGFDGIDRTYLEAWGTGCMGKEAEVYSELARTAANRDPLAWTPAYAKLVWRLTPEAAAPQFAARARAESLTEAERLAAVTALGFTPTREAADALIDLAAKAKGRVQQQALWWIINYRNLRWGQFHLDAVLKERGIYDPDTIALTGIVVPEPGPRKLTDAAAIAALKGDPKAGADLFSACMLCHQLGDRGIDYAPNLTGWAQRQSTLVLIESIINPSADIAHGFDGVEIALKDGTIIHGLAMSSGDPVIVRSTGGVTQMIPENRIKSLKRMNRSLMMSAEQLGFSAQDVANVVAYLKSL